MNLNITVELDWIEEGGSIDDEVKAEIIAGVKRSISQSCMKDMQDQSKAAFSQAVSDASSKIGEEALKFASNWLDNEVEITDKWGDKEAPISVKELIKRNFDNLLERKVDGNGRFTTGYDGKHKLIDYLTNQKVQEEVSSRMAMFGKDIDKKIKDTIAKSIKDNVSDRFAQMVIGAAKQDYQEAKALKAD